MENEVFSAKPKRAENVFLELTQWNKEGATNASIFVNVLAIGAFHASNITAGKTVIYTTAETSGVMEVTETPEEIIKMINPTVIKKKV